MYVPSRMQTATFGSGLVRLEENVVLLSSMYCWRVMCLYPRNRGTKELIIPSRAIAISLDTFVCEDLNMDAMESCEIPIRRYTRSIPKACPAVSRSPDGFIDRNTSSIWSLVSPKYTS